MIQISSANEMRAFVADLRARGQTVALVPTMGALHPGKQALIRAAAAKADAAIVSLFVNPLQFGPNEALARYPRNPAEDLERCAACGAHAAFTPETAEVFPRGYNTFVTEESLSKSLCGPARPAHFRGVATLMVQFLNLMRPQSVYFGQKTAQRAAVVRKVAEDLRCGAEIVVEPTVREADGLAAGSANLALSASQRQEALALPDPGAGEGDGRQRRAQSRPAGGRGDAPTRAAPAGADDLCGDRGPAHARARAGDRSGARHDGAGGLGRRGAPDRQPDSLTAGRPNLAREICFAPDPVLSLPTPIYP